MGAGIEPSPDTARPSCPARRAQRWVVVATLLLSACSLSRAAPPPGAGETGSAAAQVKRSDPAGVSAGAGGAPPASAAVADSGPVDRAGGSGGGAPPAAQEALTGTARDMALGREARRDGRLADAALAFERVIRADGKAFDARLELVEVLLLQSIDLGRAGALLDEAGALRSYDVQVDRLRAWLDELRGDPAAAAADYARVVAVSPDPEARLRRASLLLRVNQVDEAVAEFEKVATERPTDRATRATLADIYEYRGRLPDAERMLVEIEQLTPGELGPLRRLAAFYRRTGQFGKAGEIESRVRTLENPPRSLRPLRPSVR